MGVIVGVSMSVGLNGETVAVKPQGECVALHPAAGAHIQRVPAAVTLEPARTHDDVRAQDGYDAAPMVTHRRPVPTGRVFLADDAGIGATGERERNKEDGKAET
jgi:hypothetical protein